MMAGVHVGSDRWRVTIRPSNGLSDSDCFMSDKLSDKRNCSTKLIAVSPWETTGLEITGQSSTYTVILHLIPLFERLRSMFSPSLGRNVQGVRTSVCEIDVIAVPNRFDSTRIAD